MDVTVFGPLYGRPMRAERAHNWRVWTCMFCDVRWMGDPIAVIGGDCWSCDRTHEERWPYEAAARAERERIRVQRERDRLQVRIDAVRARQERECTAIAVGLLREMAARARTSAEAG